jgi:hypothetical protein
VSAVTPGGGGRAPGYSAVVLAIHALYMLAARPQTGGKSSARMSHAYNINSNGAQRSTSRCWPNAEKTIMNAMIDMEQEEKRAPT